MPGRLRFLRRLLGLVILTVSTGILAWGVWPLQDDSESIMIPQDHRLVLDWPGTVRSGDSQTVRMQIESNPAGERLSTTAASLAGGGATNVLAAARLEFGGLPFYPAEMVSQPLRPGKPVAFRWQINPESKGVYTGVAWLYFLSIPLGGGPETVTPISAQEIEIRTVDLFGLSGPAARFLGGLGILVGATLGLDGVWTWLLKRAQRRIGLYSRPEFKDS